MFPKSLPAILVALLFAAPAAAAQRGYTVTSFTRIRVEGPIRLLVRTGQSPRAEAEGDRRAIDRIRIESSGDLLQIGIDRSNWTGESDKADEGSAVVTVGTPSLKAISIIGAGDVSVDRVRGEGFTLTIAGAGRASIAALDVGQLNLATSGAADVRIAGHAAQGQIRSQGNGTTDAEGLDLDDADVTLIGSGEIRLNARRSARATLRGSGRIAIGGTPACTVKREGSGELICGRARP